MHQSTKHYGHEAGFSVAFRQWRATSHCRLLHGYALAFTFIFEAQELDQRNWVVDFGDLKDLKKTLEAYFDHKVLVARDDPELSWFEEGARRGVIDLIVLDAVGCEKVAALTHHLGCMWLNNKGLSPRCRLVSVEVKEHAGNSALFKG